MAISINLSSSRTRIKRTEINFDYTTSGWEVPKDTTPSAIDWDNWGSGETSQKRTGSQTYTSYSTSNGCKFLYSWVFRRNNGTASAGTSSSQNGTLATNTDKTISGFTAGSQQTLNGEVTVKRTSATMKITWTQTRTRKKNPPGEDGKPPEKPYTDWEEGEATKSSPTKIGSGKDANLGSRTKSLVFYTKPAQFSWGSQVTFDGEIQHANGLSAIKWNELVSATEKYRHWYNQNSSASYSNAKVSSNEEVSASKFNIIANALSTSTVSRNDIISASVFKSLQTAVNS